MRYLFINSVYGVRSTGKIIKQKCHELINLGNECAVAYGRETVRDSEVLQIKIGTSFDYNIHAALSRIFDKHGLYSKRATKKFLMWVEEYNPDILWLHNIHGYYINFEMLFMWIRNNQNTKVYWTLHDCWAFTGHCAYFTMAKCDRWKDGCKKCKQLYLYPKTIGFGNSHNNYLRKMKAYKEISNLTLITPSKWLADLTRESILSCFPVEVINNKIDTDVFRPVKSNVRKKYGIGNKKLILGVAADWEETKGLFDIIKLRSLLTEDYIIFLIGLKNKKKEQLPEGILSIERTDNQEELAKLYTAADVFVNPTHQDNYPTVNLEARACGTPVVTYNVGGSPESAGQKYIVDENDVEGLMKMIIQICEDKYGE